jgi:hypothetical protein
MNKKLIGFFGLLPLIFFSLSVGEVNLQSAPTVAAQSKDCQDWLLQCIKELDSIKIGSTRKGVLKVCDMSGGIVNRTKKQYWSKTCGYIKIDIEFAPVAGGEDKVGLGPNDRVTAISKPYFEEGYILD